MWQIVRVKDHYNLYYRNKLVGSANTLSELDKIRRAFKREHLNKSKTVKF